MCYPKITEIRIISAFLILICGILFISGCTESDSSDFDISGGSATLTLKEFAKQANVEIVFDAKSVEGIETKSINGNLHPYDALKKMLENTSLTMKKDPATGAFAITTKISDEPSQADKHP